MMTNALSSSFSVSIDNVLNYADRFQKQQGFIVVVLDHMNEQQSHIAHLTAHLYPIIKKNLRTTDTLIRYSQDSWLICLDDCDERLLEWTHYVLESVLHRRNRRMISFENALTAVHSGFFEKKDLNQTIKDIEHGIEAAKNFIRRLKIMRSTAIGGTENASDNQMNFVPIINQALVNNHIFISFQPIVEADSRQLSYYECLARIIDKEGQILPAGQFISQCEKSGLVQLIDLKIQQLAIEELMNDRHLRLAINVSAITGSDPLWLNTLKAQIMTRPDLRGRLAVELTETSVFQDIEESIQFMTHLRDLGCSVSIDDFGAGYMSLVHLKSDLVQMVKIDAQFVKNLKIDTNNIHFIRTIIALTQRYGIKCVAEGIEDAETANLLVQENVDYLQGYYIGKPSHFRKWI